MTDIEKARGHLVLITGGTRGLGLAVAQRLARDGYRVVTSGRSASRDVEALIECYPNRVHFVAQDMRCTSELHGFVREIVTKFGPLYALINNAAIGHGGVLATMHESQIAEILRVNIEAPILMAKYCARSMLLQRKGRIVNISSIIASTGFAGLSVYGASKAAVGGFTRSLARELGKAGITVNTVAPGYMETEMTAGLQGEKLEAIRRRSPMGGLATVQDCAGAVAYLLSDDAAHVTGTTLTVDAGSTA